MNKLLLMIMFVGATFGAYEPNELAERERVRQDVANFLKWEQQNEEEERIEKENIKRMMDQFFLKEEFDAFQKKNQKNTENILDRLNDLEEKNRLKNEELLKLQKDNERKNETILNLQSKVEQLEKDFEILAITSHFRMLYSGGCGIGIVENGLREKHKTMFLNTKQSTRNELLEKADETLKIHDPCGRVSQLKSFKEMLYL